MTPETGLRISTASFTFEAAKGKSKSVADKRGDEIKGDARITKKKLGMLRGSHHNSQTFTANPGQSFHTVHTSKTNYHQRANSTTNLSSTCRTMENKGGASFILGTQKSSGLLLSQSRTNQNITVAGVCESSGTTRTVTPQLGLDSSKQKAYMITKEISEYIRGQCNQRGILVEKREFF